MPKLPFPRVREAREALAAKAVDIWERYEAMIAAATAAGDYETANDAFKFLITHMPADPDGVRLVDHDVDKLKEKSGTSLPMINIGLAIGGLNQPKELPPAEVIEVKPENE